MRRVSGLWRAGGLGPIDSAAVQYIRPRDSRASDNRQCPVLSRRRNNQADNRLRYPLRAVVAATGGLEFEISRGGERGLARGD